MTRRVDRPAAVDDLSRPGPAGPTSPTVVQRIVHLVAEAMPAGVEVSVTVVRGRHPSTAAATGRWAAGLDAVQHDRGCGPCLDAALGGAPVEVPDARAEDRWPRCVPALLERGALSVLAAPVPAEHAAAGLTVYARSPRAFTGDDRDTLVEFAAVAGAALTTVDALQDARDVAADLRRALDSRVVVEQAKGILIERHRLTAAQAFRLLADASANTHRSVRDVAEHLVLTGELALVARSRRPPLDTDT